MSPYFSYVSGMTRPEEHCLREMVTGILKSKTVLVNRIAASLREGFRLKDVCKRFYAQCLKEDYAEEVRASHPAKACKGGSQNDFIVIDGTDIQKKCARDMEGQLVQNGNTRSVGLGYNVLNIKAVSAQGDNGILKDFFLSRCPLQGFS